MISELRVGNQIAADGATIIQRADKSGATVNTNAHGRYMEAVLRGNVYTASNTNVGVAFTALGTTATGLIISNPPGSGKNLVLLEWIVAPTTAPAGIATILLGASPGPQATDSTHTTPLTVRSALWVGTVGGSVGKADSAATLVGTPVVARVIPGGPVATGSINSMFIKDEIAGALILTPGTAISTFFITTAISAICTATWEEVPV